MTGSRNRLIDAILWCRAWHTPNRTQGFKGCIAQAGLLHLRPNTQAGLSSDEDMSPHFGGNLP